MTKQRDAGPFGPSADDELAGRLFPPLSGSVQWGLGRMDRVLASVGGPHRCAPVLHVAGSNGKGSVARIWASVLKASGLRVGLYTSPHLVSFRERILVDGRPLADVVLEDLAEELRPWLLRVQPSFFEAATALAFLAFARSEVDVMVVEVGLGGRLDATNVVQPVLTAITNVSLDHQELLGSDLASIAREKAGILKPGVPAYTATQASEALAVLKEEAVALGVPLTRIRPPSGTWTMAGLRCDLVTRRWGTLALEAPLRGDHQLANLALAVLSLQSLPPRLLPGARAVVEGVAAVRMPGRLQVEEDPPRRWIFDVAHNADGMRTLAASLQVMPSRAPVVAVTGILADKDWEGMITTLAEVVEAGILTRAPGAPEVRQWDPDAAVARLPGLDLIAIPELPEALERARELTRAGGTIVVTGSAYTVGAALRFLDRVPPEALPPSEDFG